MDRGISPRVTNSVDLGSASKAWRKLYAKRIDEGTYIPGAYNKKETFTTSGTFTAPVTGVYRITLQGGGGGGAGAGTRGDNNMHYTGGGGGQGGHLEFYEKLTAGVSYSYTIGTGGAGGTAGTSTTDGAAGAVGGDTSISVNNNVYTGSGGMAGLTSPSALSGGHGGSAKINSTVVGCGSAGANGVYVASATVITRGGNGGGAGGGNHENYGGWRKGSFGGGGAGGLYGANEISAGGAGGNGYITFEYYDPTA